MDLPSLFRRKAPAAKADRIDVPGDADAARTRARRRLIGAVVLLGVGIIAFPLLFETEPRPIPVDLPIEIPSKDQVPPLAMPPPAPAGVASGRVSEPATPAEKPPQPSAPVVAVPAPPPAKPAAEPSDDGARAKALLDGRTVPPPASAPGPAARFVVQIGAFAEARTVRDVRAKVEQLGMKTYTQVVKVEAGERTRVRVGPFADRSDAEAAAAELKKAGLPAAVLSL